VESTCKTVAPSSAALEPGFIVGKDEAALLRRCGRSAAKSSPSNWPEIPHRPTRPRYRKTYPALVTRQYRAGHHECPTVAPPSDLPVDGRDPPWPGRRQRCGIRIQVHAAMVVSEEAAAEKYMPQLQHNMWVVAARTAVLSVITGGGKGVEITTHALYPQLFLSRFVGEHIDRCLGRRAGRGSVNLAKVDLHVDLDREGDLVQHVSGLVNPTALVPGARKDLLDRLPEAERAVADRQVGRNLEPALFDVDEKLAPALCALTDPGLEANEFLLPSGVAPISTNMHSAASSIRACR
jgi:hypothetical protein